MSKETKIEIIVIVILVIILGRLVAITIKEINQNKLFQIISK